MKHPAWAQATNKPAKCRGQQGPAKCRIHVQMFFVHCHCSLSFGVMASVFGWAREMTSATHLLFSLFDCVELWFVLVVFLDVTHTKFLLANCMGPCHQQTCKYAGGSNSQQNAVVMYWLSYRGLLFFSFGNVGAGVGGLVCVCMYTPSLFPKHSRLFYRWLWIVEKHVSKFSATSVERSQTTCQHIFNNKQGEGGRTFLKMLQKYEVVVV